MKKTIITILLLACCAAIVSAQGRERLSFDRDWLFRLADSAAMSSPGYDDSHWRRLHLPHDWAIEGCFSASAPAEAGGGALPGGTAWYRKHFSIDAVKDAGRRIYIDFDGVYMNSTVWINGHEIGTRPYGYSSFRYDITDHVRPGAANVVAVRVDNSDQPNSRWYSGCGIYRHVWLVKTAQTHVDHWGTFVSTAPGKVNISVALANHTGKPERLKVVNTLTDSNRLVVGRDIKTVTVAQSLHLTASIRLRNPHLWSTDRPYIYKVKTQLVKDGMVIDTYETPFGVRTASFDAAKGFSLNGRPMKINGVCLHHDMGCLGAAVSEDAIHRQLRILKQMGCNVLRCSHNPPAPELLAMADTMGFLVMDESFDMWRRRKTKNDYARFFDRWAVRDLADMVMRDRNHPSVIMWSIGNEVLEQWSSAAADTLSVAQANLILNAGRDASQLAADSGMSVNSLLARHLAAIVRRIDPTRPITAGCNEPSPNNHLFKSGAFDIIGFNYHHRNIKDVPRHFPGKPFIVTESVSAIQTRGCYMMPADSVMVEPKEWWMPYRNPSFMCSAYDNMHVAWGTTHEQMLRLVESAPYVSGQFVWTGFDYLGEPMPYEYPARSSYFGIVDLAGFPKDVYYLYQSRWTNKPVLHLFPHWNWLEGQTVDLWCYYNRADEVELFVNGRSAGVSSQAATGTLHAAWRVRFEPGEITAVARRKGREVGRKTIRTAGQPHHIRLTPDKTAIAADGRSLAFVEVEVVDKCGNLCPNATNTVYFDVEGGEIAGVDNGSQASLEMFKAGHRKAFFGKCLVVVRADSTAGRIRLAARAVDLAASELHIVKTRHAGDR